jgi:P pilus assembly chaperone PapD
MKFHTCVLAVILIFMSYQGHADLLITPTRIVFSERDRVQEVILVNTASEPRTYALAWLEMKQLDNLAYAKLDDNEAKAFARASDFIRFTPRRLTLQPGENQRIKLMLRRTSNSQDKDYRSHLKFTVIPNAVMQDDSNDESTNANGTQIKLNLFLNYSIPVMIKNDSSAQNIAISNLAFRKNIDSSTNATLTFVLNKTSPGFTFGDITLLFKAEGGSEFVPVGYTNNVSVYHESNLVKADVVWTEPVAIQAGQLKIVYKGKRESVDTLYVEASLQIK